MHWPYTKRPDGRIAITLDNNVWDFLFDRGIDLASELPSEDFAVFITREVEIEGSAMPDDPSKTALEGYIAQAISSCDIQTTSVFGFASPDPGPQRVGGFGHWTWQSRTESEFYAAIRARFLVGKRETESQLTQNEADAAVAAQSHFSIALICERPNKTGPLRFASEHGGMILYLEDFDTSGLTLKAFITACYRRM